MELLYTTRQLTIKSDFKQTHYLIPFGDVHRDASGCDVDRWHWFLKNASELAEENPSTWFLSMGDTHDFGSFSEGKKIKNANLHKTTLDKFDELSEKDNRAFCREISFMRGKMLGFIEGNHLWVKQDGKNSTEDLAERMGSESLGWLCHYTLNFEFPNGSSVNVYVVACHGKAGGKTAGNSINQVDQLRNIFPASDILIMGHDHERWARPIDVLIPTTARGGVKLRQKRQMLCRSGAFLKGYVDGVASYTVAGLYRPSDLGSVVLKINFHRDQRGGEDRVITDIKAII